jgi:hypothetical protein
VGDGRVIERDADHLFGNVHAPAVMPIPDSPVEPAVPGKDFGQRVDGMKCIVHESPRLSVLSWMGRAINASNREFQVVENFSFSISVELFL